MLSVSSMFLEISGLITGSVPGSMWCLVLRVNDIAGHMFRRPPELRRKVANAICFNCKSLAIKKAGVDGSIPSERVARLSRCRSVPIGIASRLQDQLAVAGFSVTRPQPAVAGSRKGVMLSSHPININQYLILSIHSHSFWLIFWH